MRLKFLPVLTLSLLSPLAHAECLDATRFEKELLPEFTFVNAEGEKVKPDLCKEDSVGYHTVETLLFLKDLPSLKQPASPFNHNFLPESPFNFFRERVKKVVLDERPESSECPDQRLAYVAPYAREEKRIWVCPKSLNYGLITFSSTLLHEARHVEGAEHNHRRCRDGLYAGENSCDEAYSSGAAYGVGLEYLVKLSREKSLPAEARESARRLAVMDFVQRFNEKPLDLEAGLLLRKEGTEELFFFDGKKESPAGFSAPRGSVLSSQGGLPLIFFPETGKARLYLYTNELGTPVSDVLTRRFEELPAEERKSLVDVAYGAELACLLLKTGLECFGPDQEPFRVALPAGEPRRLLYSARSRVIPAGVFHLVMADGFSFQLPRTAAELKASNPKAWLKSTGPIDLQALQKLGSTEIGVDGQGRIVKLEGRRGTKLGPVPGLGAGYRDILPFHRSKQLGEL